MATKLLLDTNVLIDALRGYKPAINYVEAITEIYVSVVTASELMYGCKNRIELNKISKLLSYYNILHIDEEISKKALSLYEKYFLEKRLSFDDALIGATALCNDFVLVTKNVEHFSDIYSLIVEIPY